MKRLTQIISLIVGFWMGHHLPEHKRCYRCGAPGRDGRYFCTNRFCDNWVPF